MVTSGDHPPRGATNHGATNHRATNGGSDDPCLEPFRPENGQHPPLILVVDDDEELRAIVDAELRQHNFETAGCSEGRRALEIIRSRQPDLVVLDLGLPDIGGLDILQQIRDVGSLPVIVLTGRSAEADRIVGLEMGADDYVVKPFSPRELAARVKTVLRRSAGSTDGEAATRLTFERLVIDLASRDVIVDDRFIDLTAKEFDLLAFLAESPRQVFSRTQLLRMVWGSDPEWQSPSTVAEHVHRLRRKIELDPASPQWIHTMRGAGYRFVP